MLAKILLYPLKHHVTIDRGHSLYSDRRNQQQSKMSVSCSIKINSIKLVCIIRRHKFNCAIVPIL